MREQLAAGLVLGAVAAAAGAMGLAWLAVAALAAALPFLVVGIALALGEVRTRSDRRAGTVR
ncbi:MAG TPA: hypothetical protein VI503_06115 [Gaiellaceae bacterium]|nr:hypothetical protein [Gaiellaceae bacterium]